MRISFMRKLTQWSKLAAVAAVVGTFGCKSLEVTNPNAPDAARAFSDPGAVAGLVTGAMHSWFNTRGTYYGAETLDMMADSYTSSWNNMNNRYYSSYGPIGNFQANCPQRCGWVNNTSDPKRLWVEGFWYGYYGLLSSVNDVLTAIRTNHVDLGGTDVTNMHEAIAVMLQAVVFSGISQNYDKGFVVTEATDISNPASLPFRPRAEMRDSAIAKFNQAIALLQAHPFAQSPSTWTGVVNGTRYSSEQFIRVIHTAQAEVLANFARNATEDGQTNWGQVATYAAQGVSSGTAFTFNFYVDTNTLIDFVKLWGNAYGDARVDTRVAHIITAGPDPSRVQADPWAQTPQFNAYDARVGNGTWGPEDGIDTGTLAADAGAGTDFAWFPHNGFNQSRGPYHNSQLGHIRYSYLASPGSGLPGEDGRGQAPVYEPQYNDLLWAEGLLRGGGSATQAAALINKTREGRGHLAPLTGAEGQAALLAALRYEQEIEEMGNGSVPFYNRRRETPEGWAAGVSDPRTVACPALICLWPDTPRHQPVPAKELSVLQQELYSFGGPGVPDLAPSYVGGEAVFSARQIADAMQKKRPGNVKKKW
jgi:hypothetical protein